MTHIETARVNEVIGVQIGMVQEAARKLNPGLELEQLEAEIAALEKTVQDLKMTLAGLPFRRY